MSKHSPDILFTTPRPSAYGNARRLIATALNDRHQRTYFGGTNPTHTWADDGVTPNLPAVA